MAKTFKHQREWKDLDLQERKQTQRSRKKEVKHLRDSRKRKYSYES